MNPQEAFIDLLLAAMKDALFNEKLTQFVAQMDPDGKGLRRVRIIVVPEEMGHEWPTYAPLGTRIKGN